MTGRTQQTLLHFAGCVIFLALPFLFSPESLSLHSYLTNPPTQRDIIAYVLVLGAFYTNYYLLIPRFYFPRKYIRFILFNLLCFSLIAFLPGLLLHHPGDSYQQGPPPDGRSLHTSPPNAGSHEGAPPDEFHAPPPDGRPDSPSTFTRPPEPPDAGFPMRPRPAPHFRDLSEHFFLFLVVLFLALLLKIRDRWIRAEDEKLHAELAYLKAQINPHFLFNTLNSIYAMALAGSDQTPGAIVRLSSMMRYVLVEAGKEKVPLEQEITYLTDYTTLQQTRFQSSLQLDLTINGRPEGRSIVPLLLIPFVENAFKHGVNPEEPSAIGIRIDIADHELQLHVTNNKVTVHHPESGPGGLGIQNTRQRLQMLYPGKHTLIIEDQPRSFTVFLTLKGI